MFQDYMKHKKNFSFLLFEFATYALKCCALHTVQKKEAEVFYFFWFSSCNGKELLGILGHDPLNIVCEIWFSVNWWVK